MTGNRTLTLCHTNLDNSRLTVRADGVYPDTVVAFRKLFGKTNVNPRRRHLRDRNNRRVRPHADTQIYQHSHGVALRDGVESGGPNAVVGCDSDDVEVFGLHFSKQK